MKTTVLASCTPEDEAMLAERRRLGQDRLDEVWQGEYHMVPGPHSRHGLVGAQLLHLLHDPAHAPGLSVIVDPGTEIIHWFALGPDGYGAVDRSQVLDLAVATVAGAMDW